jgi:histidyl-tRNA synthetase
VIRLNHRRVLTALLDAAGVPTPLHGDALVALDKLDKIGVDGVAREFGTRSIADAAGQKALSFFVAGAGETPEAALARLGTILGEHEALANLAEIAGLVASTPAAARIRIDPSLARGLSYYTGAIMEIAVEGIGSLGGGGRYDNLVGMFLGRNVPACGFSLGLERIIVLMTERKMFPPAVAGAAVDIVVTLWSDLSRSDSVALAAELRQKGLRVDLYPEADKLGKQFKYASSRQAPFVAIVGDDERARGEVAVKDLRSGEQTSMARDQVAAFVLANLGTLEP